MEAKEGEGVGMVGLTAMVVAGRKNIVTAAIPFMVSLWVRTTLESCWMTMLKLCPRTIVSYIAFHITNTKARGTIFFCALGYGGGGGGGREERIRSPYQINDVLHPLLHTLHPDLPALKLCYFLL